MENPSLREEPRQQNAPIMEARQDASILGWLEGLGRLMDRDHHERAKVALREEEGGEDIHSLIAGDDDFDLDDQDDQDND
ncbi:MAG: DUF3134 family protein [Acaryochloridaceae cyanobacterium CSU_5_19]|nr:DUF3134 family protein [Acaryochloridaceae cyanobacterium CSU_5_19]